tara:strand:- start:706 stop:849 length:144 start_codon:yes stop_codon:yes gene_type:complete
MNGAEVRELRSLLKNIVENAIINDEHRTIIYDEIHYILHNMIGVEEE